MNNLIWLCLLLILSSCVVSKHKDPIRMDVSAKYDIKVYRIDIIRIDSTMLPYNQQLIK